MLRSTGVNLRSVVAIASNRKHSDCDSSCVHDIAKQRLHFGRGMMHRRSCKLGESAAARTLKSVKRRSAIGWRSMFERTKKEFSRFDRVDP
jgi:hypothetical protein